MNIQNTTKNVFLCSALFMALIFCYPKNIYAQLAIQKNTTLLSKVDYPQGLSNIWYYVSPSNREYAVVGTVTGTSFVDVTDPEAPLKVAFVPGPESTWRELRTWGHYAYVVTENQDVEGLQVINLQDLDNGNVTSTYWDAGKNITTAHTIGIDEKGFAYLYGDAIYQGAAILDLNQDPWNPPFVGAYTAEYIHDGFVRGDTLWAAQIYKGVVSIIDVSDKQNPVELGNFYTPDKFTHNCWVTSNNQYIFTTDEVNDAYIAAYNVADITDVKEIDRIQSQNAGAKAPPHNTYIVNDRYVVTSYYKDGVTIHDALYPDNLVLMGYYDTSPLEGAGYDGAWGVCPYLPSGNLLVSDMQEGMFVIQPKYKNSCYFNGQVVDAQTNAGIANAKIKYIGVVDPNVNTTAQFGGYFKSGVSDEGLYNIEVSAIGYYTTTLTNVDLTEGTIVDSIIKLTPLPSFVLEGIVLDTLNQPIPNAIVVAQNGELLLSDTTDANGNYKFSTFYEGTYQVIVGAWGYLPQYLDNVSISFGFEPPILKLIPGYYDDFNADFGWQSSGTSTTGKWERGIPVPTGFGNFVFNPGSDVSTDKGKIAYVTGNSDDFYDFVYDGTAILTSPPINATIYNEPQVRCYVWYASFAEDFNTNDTLFLIMDNGNQTVVIDTIALSPGGTGWVAKKQNIKSTLPITNNMHFKLLATANDDPELLECGLDVFQIIEDPNVGLQTPQPNTTTAQVSTYPNPFSNTANVLILNWEKVLAELNGTKPQLCLYNATGQKIFETTVNQQLTQISANQLPQGVYYFNIQGNGNIIAKGKLIIQ